MINIEIWAFLLNNKFSGELMSLIPDKLKILHLASTHRWTGVADPLTNLAVNQKKLGHEVYISCQPGASFERHIHENKLNFFNKLNFNTDINLYKTFKDLKRLKIFITKNDINVIHTYLNHDNWIAGLIHDNQKNRILVRTFHKYTAPRKDICHKYLFLTKTDLLIAVNNATRDLLCKSLKIPEERIKVVYGAVDIDKFSPQIDGNKIRNEFNISSKSIVIGLVSRLGMDRGLDWFLKAAFNVLDENTDVCDDGANVFFLIVGKGNAKNFIKQKINFSKYMEKIILAGYRNNDLPEVYSSFDFSLFLALSSESSCRAILEAMSSGKPVIGIDIPPVREIIQDGKTGYLFPEKNPKKLAETICKYINNRKEIQQHGIGARHFVEENFNPVQRAEKTTLLYKEALQKKAG